MITQNQETIKQKIQNWIDDLESIKDDPVYGDPYTTIKLVIQSMKNLMNKLKK